MKKINKTLLSLGTLASVIAPIATVVACGTPSTEMGEKEAKFIAFVKSAKGKRVLDAVWMDKVLIQISTDWKKPVTSGKITAGAYQLLSTTETKPADRLIEWKKQLTKDLIIESVRKNPSYLTSLSSQIRGIDGSDKIKALLNGIGFDREYHSDNYENAAGNVFEATKKSVFETLFEMLNGIDNRATKDVKENQKYIKLGFASQINNLIIAKAYMSVDKSQWSDVFSVDNKNDDDSTDKTHTITLTPVQELIDKNSNFVLNMYALKHKFSYQWSAIATKEEDAQIFRTRTITNKYIGTDLGAAIGELSIKAGKLGSFDNYSKKKDKFHNSIELFDLTKGFGKDAGGYTKFKDMTGFNGLVSLKTGTGQLNFSKYGLIDKSRLSNKDWGILQKNDIVQTDIKFFDKDVKDAMKAPIELTAVVAIIPRPENGRLKLNASKSTVQFNLGSLSTLFAIKTDSFYKDAIKYFSNKKTNPIVVDVKDDYIKNILKDEGIGYIK